MAIIQTDMNATELRIIEVIDKYVIYMISKHAGMIEIYPKLLELEGGELTDWIYDELVEWLGNGVDYEYSYDCECEEDCECEKTATITSFSINDYIQYILCKKENPNETYDKIRNFYDSIFTNCRELIQIQGKITDTLQQDIEDFEDYYSLSNIVKNYCYIYLREMEEGLKEYIINLLDPVEPK
jgi:hypothetical protein